MNTAPQSPARLLARVRESEPASASTHADAPRIKAAVMALISDEPNPRVVFIERALRDDPWAGQIAFPGGRIDPTDASPQATALRELNEELGIPARDVRDVCTLGTFRTLTHRVEVAAFVGRWSMHHPYQPDPREVADVLTPRLATLRTLSPITETMDWEGTGRVSFPVYHLNEARVWGLTARILQHLLGAIA